MIFDYVVLVLMNCLGALQIAAARNRFRRLLFFQNPHGSVILGLGFGALGFIWFFRSGPLHIPDTAGGLAGFQQFALFSFGAVAALLLNRLLASLLFYLAKGIFPGELQGLSSVNISRLLKIFLRKWQNY